jgi:cytochrome c556
MSRSTSQSRQLILFSTFGFCLVLGFSLLEAQEDDQPFVEYRQNLMSGQGASMAAIGDILKYKLPYSTNHIAIYAKNISEYTTLIPDAFKKPITAGATDAKPEIWQNWDDFTAKAKAVEEASAKLSAVAATGDMKAIMPAVKALGDSCKACHNSYRKPKEESYKQKSE